MISKITLNQKKIKCNDLEGTFECICDKGYRDVNGDGRNCVLIDQEKFQKISYFIGSAMI